MFGMICAFGMFTRFTFIFFALPLVVLLADFGEYFKWAIGYIVSAGAMIMIDSLYFVNCDLFMFRAS